MKWLTLGAKAFAHPSLLPIALATFVSVAGPGGIAEFGRNVPTGPIVAVAPENLPVLANDPPPVLVRLVHGQVPVSVSPVVDAEAPPPAEPNDAIGKSGDVLGAGEAPLATAGDQDITPSVEPDQSHIDGGEPPSDSNPPEQPADGPAGPSTEPEEPPDDVIDPDIPPEEGGDVDEEPPVEDGGDDASDDSDQSECDVPGNGHDKHDVEPGHDKDNDGTDDRCQQDEGDDEGTVDGECDVPGEGHDNHPVEPGHDEDGDGVDDRCQQHGGDEGTVDGECDVPGEGHDNHSVEPGHDKDGDGIDDRCQQNDDGENNAGISDGGRNRNDSREDEG